MMEQQGLPPLAAAAVRDARWHVVEIDTTGLDGTHSMRRVEGDDAWVAAALRALANQLDPPPPPAPPKLVHR